MITITSYLYGLNLFTNNVLLSVKDLSKRYMNDKLDVRILQKILNLKIGVQASLNLSIH